MKILPILFAASLALLGNAPAHAQAGAGTTSISRAGLGELLDAYGLIRLQYVNPVDDRKLLTAAIGGMLKSLDPHSEYLDKDDLLALERENSGQYVGIGLTVAAESGAMRVQSVAENGPAQHGGVRAGDRVISLDGRPVTGLAYGEMARRFGGAPGSVAELVLAREGVPALQTLHIVRAALRTDTVSVKRVGDDLAWIRIAEFGGATAADVAGALAGLGADSIPAGLILDLRNDPGGLVSAAAGVASAFLAPDQALFLVRGRGAEERVDVGMGADALHAVQSGQAPAWARTVPLVVLVNGASASAAELLAGALQDHKRATVVGARTFGKGTIQSVIPLSADSAVKMTVARYVTPLGREIQATGLMPDVVVAGTPGVPLLREADLARHLPLEGAPAGDAGPAAAAEDSKLFGSAGDRALQAAIAQLQPEKKRPGRCPGAGTPGWQAWPVPCRRRSADASSRG
jgi:carboxyl-terminal processing protease